MGWQWHQLHHMQITCTALQTGNHARTSPDGKGNIVKENSVVFSLIWYALAAVSKAMWVVKLWYNEILQFLTAGAS